MVLGACIGFLLSSVYIVSTDFTVTMPVEMKPYRAAAILVGGTVFSTAVAFVLGGKASQA
jgi:hypothetical protein